MRIRILLGACFLLGVLVGFGFYLTFVLAPYFQDYETHEIKYLDSTTEYFIVYFSPIIQGPFIWADSHELMQIHLEKESSVSVEVFARDNLESPTKPISVYVVIQHEQEWSYTSHKSMFYYDKTYVSWDIPQSDNYIIRAVSTEQGVANITIRIYPTQWESSTPYRAYSNLVFFLGIGLIIGCPIATAILILKLSKACLVPNRM